MSKIKKYIKERSENNPEFAKGYRNESAKLDVAVAVRNLRDELGLTQRELADLVNKPQSTIGRIENGQMNPSVNILSEIAEATKKHLTIEFA